MGHGQGVQDGRDAQHAELVQAGLLLRPHPALLLYILTLLTVQLVAPGLAGWKLDVPPRTRASAENAQRMAHPAQVDQIQTL